VKCPLRKTEKNICCEVFRTEFAQIKPVENLINVPNPQVNQTAQFSESRLLDSVLQATHSQNLSGCNFYIHFAPGQMHFQVFWFNCFFLSIYDASFCCNFLSFSLFLDGFPPRTSVSII
jgi:hypothetical protein